MLRQITSSACLGTLLAVAATAQEQQLAVPDNDVRVIDAGPAVQVSARTGHLMRFAGAFKDYMGRPMTGVHGVTFALYRDQEGGSPIWLETTSVEFDEQGRFTALLGAVSEHGLTPELFASGEPRWLGVQLQLPGHEEHPRTLLVAVPYALRALDADTLGGRPASAYVLAPNQDQSSEAARDPAETATFLDVSRPGPVLTHGASYILRRDSGTGYEDSAIYQSALGNIGIGTASPVASLDVEGQVRISNLGHAVFYKGDIPGTSYWFRKGLPSAYTDLVVIDNDGRVGIGVTAPAQKLEVAGDVLLTGTRSVLFTTGDNMTSHRGGVQFLTYNNGVNNIWTPTDPSKNPVNNSTVLLGGFGNFNTATVHVGVSGNLGVGSPGGIVYPGEKLQVNGNIKLITPGNGIIFPDGTVQTTAAGSLAFAADQLRSLVTKQQQQIERLQSELLELRTTVELFRSARSAE